MSVKEELQGKATDFVKKILTVGVGAVFLTEESVRTLLSDSKLPKELLTGVLESASKTRKEFFKSLSQDLMKSLQDHISPEDLVQEILSKNKIKLNIEMEFEPKTSSKGR